MTKSRLTVYTLCAIAGAFAIHSAVKNLQQFDGIAGHTMPAKEMPSALVRSLRPNYPYSVIAGGVYSGPELTYANSKDPVVRAHYADFRVAQAKLVQLTDDRYQYASYRVKNQVYWTKKKLKIPKGELLWSDGQSFARARCGNRLSDKPNQPTGPTDPPEALLSLPPVRPDMLAKLDLVQPLAGVPTDIAPEQNIVASAASPAPVTPIPAPVGTVWGQGPVVFPVSPILSSPGGPGVPTLSPLPPTTPTSTTTPIPPLTPTPPVPVTPAPPPVAPVPEPGSALYLFFIALAGSLWAIWKFSPKSEPEEIEGKEE